MTDSAVIIRRSMQPVATVVSLIALGAGIVLLMPYGWRHMALLLIGALLGMSLFHGTFGFTSSYRNMMLRRDVSGPIAQVVLLAMTTALFAPVLAAGQKYGVAVGAAVAPAGLGVAVGSFLFGIGMQVAGGCGSGTLYTVGGGSLRMLVALVFFCLGGFVASLHMGFWQALPGLGSVSLAGSLGWPWAILLQFLSFGLILLALRSWSRSTGGVARPMTIRCLVYGPWPLNFAAIMLAVLGLTTLLVAEHPWTITWGFTLWGAKVAKLLGWNPAMSLFWQDGFQAKALQGSVLADVTSVMNIGIMIGAFLAASLAGKFAPNFSLRVRPLTAAILGGLLMGYGARIAYGCNIGALVAGIASTSLHGWLWLACVLPGNWVGIKLRPLLGMQN